jgi:hypothetical protein
MTAVRPTGTGFPDTLAERLADIAELCRRFGVRRLDLFGSSATDTMISNRVSGYLWVCNTRRSA